MKKIIALVVLAVLLIGSSVVAFAWWDTLQQNTSNTFNVGTGVVLQIDGHIQDDRALVPAGSFYADYQADYTTEYVLTYTLSLEEQLKSGMKANLEIDLKNFVLGSYNKGFNAVDSVVSIDVNGLVETANGQWTIVDAFTSTDNTVTVSFTFSLANTPNPAFASAYDLVRNQVPTFNLEFLVVNTSSSVN